MPTDVIMPALGVTQETGTLLNWRKGEGQSVIQGEPLMEVETDKATVEIEAPASGILAYVSAFPGEEVPVGNRIAVILAPGEQLEAAVPPASQPRKTLETPQKSQPAKAETSPAVEISDARLIRASPAARRLAREKAIELGALSGTGPQGAVLAADVLRGVAAKTSQATAGQILPLTPMRRIVGRRMTENKQTAPHFYVAADIEMTRVDEKRKAWKEAGESGVPSINDFILCACARALRQFPALNSTFSEEGIRILADIDIGMAVALDDGLVVPVIRRADQLSLRELARQSRELVERAQRKKLFPVDYEGGTFTVSNLGMLGIDSFTAIINPPQCAILAVGRVTPRVVADEQGLMIRSMMTATLSADHRIVDGAIAARFLREVKKRLERSGL